MKYLNRCSIHEIQTSLWTSKGSSSQSERFVISKRKVRHLKASSQDWHIGTEKIEKANWIRKYELLLFDEKHHIKTETLRSTVEQIGLRNNYLNSISNRLQTGTVGNSLISRKVQWNAISFSVDLPSKMEKDTVKRGRNVSY